MQGKFTKIAIVAAATMFAGNAMADQLTVQEALNRVGGQRRLVLSQKGENNGMKLTYTAQVGNNNCYYVVSNANNQGFMVISADDCAPAVLASFDNAQFDPNNMPIQMKGMLNHYQNIINAAINSGRRLDNAKPSEASDIDILCRTTWQQAAPYNNDCTELLNSGQVTAEEKSLTGCVATAMAQCLFYFYDKWGYQANPSGTVSYTIHYKNEKNVAGCKAGDLAVSQDLSQLGAMDYANMILMYDEFAYTDAQAAAVANLMHAAGLSLKMQYEDKTGGSSALDDDIPTAFKDFWGFDAGVKYVIRANKDGNNTAYSDQEWVDLIYGELKGARPVMYGALGRGKNGEDTGGHEFIIDGYRTSDGLFHVNWGWENGYCNGWCYMSNDDIYQVLKPESQTSGSTGTADSSNDPYANGQGAIIGIQPQGFAEMQACDPQGKNGTKEIKEDVNYTNSEDMTCDVKYTRSFTGKWQALYLPFAIPAESLSEFEVAEPSQCDGKTLSISSVTSTEANGIYFIKAKEEGVKTIEVAGATLTAASSNTKEIEGGYSFTGTSSSILGKNWNEAWYAMGTDGTLLKTNADLASSQEAAIIKPHRWYMAAPSGVAAMNIEFDDEQATGIVATTTTVQKQAYNLCGQRVDANTKGIIIVNGKKVWNK